MGYIDESHPFICGSVLKKFQGTIYHLHDLQIRPTRIWREDILGKSWRCATFDAENVQTGEPVILLLRVEPDPTVLEQQSLGLRQFQEEWQAYKNASQSGYTPDYIAHANLTQDDRYEYPGGHLGVLVVSKPRTPTADIGDLERSDLPTFAKACEDMFRMFRSRGYSMGFNALTMEYNVETKWPYVFEFALAGFGRSDPPPLSDLIEMTDIEDAIKVYFGEDARRELFGEPSVIKRPENDEVFFT